MQISSESGAPVVIRCSNIGKRYRIGRRERYKTLRDTLAEIVSAPISRLRPNSRNSGNNPEIWALRNISLEVRKGEILGVIGRNGSGKSTLLKILAGITKPSEGSAEIRGRIGSLLEVGAGFHPELTGRKNIYLHGAILGMRRQEIDRKFDEIVDFAECGPMLDTPIKHYSSGMYVRLAFAVAAHLETEILLADEVLAVGDAAFQKKCLGKIGHAADRGRTVLFVSHNLLAVESLCTRAVCLHAGQLVMQGAPGEVTSRYLKEWIPAFTQVVHEDISTAPGNEIVRLHSARVLAQDGSSTDWLTVRTALVVEFEYWRLSEEPPLYLFVELFNEYDVSVLTTLELKVVSGPAGLYRSQFTIPGDLLNNGTYRIRLLICQKGFVEQLVVDWDNLLAFEIHDVASELRGDYHGEWYGVVRPALQWKTERVQPLSHPVR